MACTVLMNGWSMNQPHTCNASILICISFYFLNKQLMYFFLVERAYLSSSALASHLSPRLRSLVFLTGTSIVLIGVGLLGSLAFMYPVTFLSSKDHRCLIGEPRKVAGPLLAYDLTIHFALTLYFFIKSWQSFYGMELWQFGGYIKLVFLHIIPRCENSLLVSLMVRSMMGLFLAILPTIANLTTLYIVQGKEKVWVCWTVCTIDSEIHLPNAEITSS